MSSLSYSQDDVIQLPYHIKPNYPKKMTTGIVMARMIDELGYKYYWATDSLLNDELSHSFHSSNLPRLLLRGVYQMSENIITYTSENSIKPELNPEEMSFEDLRKNTLFNLKEVSHILINNRGASRFLNWNPFIKSVAYFDTYCDQIILFRENIGKPFNLKDDFIEQEPYRSKMFDQSLGADGLSNIQWMKILERGGGRYADRVISHAKTVNQHTIVALRKEERATVTVGKLESIALFSNNVEGLTYTYFNVPPEQLSFLFSNDNELLEGIINWMIYINSGNPVKLSEMFRVGLDMNMSLETNEEHSLVRYRYRDVADHKENKVRLEFSDSYFDKTKFSDITIKEVHINNDNQIEFFGKTNGTDPLSKEPEQPIILLKNIEGDLLKRFKMNVHQMREGLNEYDDRIMNVRKY